MSTNRGEIRSSSFESKEEKSVVDRFVCATLLTRHFSKTDNFRAFEGSVSEADYKAFIREYVREQNTQNLRTDNSYFG